MDPLPEGWHPETHNFDGTEHGRISSSLPFEHSLFMPEAGGGQLGAVRGAPSPPPPALPLPVAGLLLLGRFFFCCCETDEGGSGGWW